MASAPGVTVYGAPYSVYVRIVRLALEEKGVPYALDPVDIFTDEEASETYRELNPFGKIPTFRHDDFLIYETQAITRYIDEAFEGPSLQQNQPKARARMAQVMGIIDSYAYRTLVWDIYVAHVARTKESTSENSERIAEAIPFATTCLRELNRLLDGRAYFGGVSPSLADLHATPVIGYFRTVPEATAILAGFAGLTNWWANMSTRESWNVASESSKN